MDFVIISLPILFDSNQALRTSLQFQGTFMQICIPNFLQRKLVLILQNCRRQCEIATVIGPLEFQVLFRCNTSMINAVFFFAEKNRRLSGKDQQMSIYEDGLKELQQLDCFCYRCLRVKCVPIKKGFLYWLVS